MTTNCLETQLNDLNEQEAQLKADCMSRGIPEDYHSSQFDEERRRIVKIFTDKDPMMRGVSQGTCSYTSLIKKLRPRYDRLTKSFMSQGIDEEFDNQVSVITDSLQNVVCDAPSDIWLKSADISKRRARANKNEAAAALLLSGAIIFTSYHALKDENITLFQEHFFKLIPFSAYPFIKFFGNDVRRGIRESDGIIPTFPDLEKSAEKADALLEKYR